MSACVCVSVLFVCIQSLYYFYSGQNLLKAKQQTCYVFNSKNDKYKMVIMFQLFFMFRTFP